MAMCSGQNKTIFFVTQQQQHLKIVLLHVKICMLNFRCSCCSEFVRDLLEIIMNHIKMEKTH